MSSLEHRLEVAAEAVWQAGRITLRYFQTRLEGLDVVNKPDRSPVTRADREAESFLVTALAREFPHDAFLGEELGERPGTSGYRWILDPIDGTESFVRGVPLYGVLAGLEDPGGDAVLGVICLPALGELLAAARGEGCRLNGRRVRVSAVARLADACIAYAEDLSFVETGTLDVQRRVLEQARSARSWCDCYGHFLVATGRVEAMLDPVLSLWDCAALKPVVEEAGGVFTDWQGRPTIHGASGISSNRALAAELRELVRSHGPPPGGT